MTDKPDVIVRGDRNVGIEITNLYIKDGTDSSSEQVQIARRLKILQKAQTIYRAQGGKAVELSVAFSFDHPVREKSDVQRIAEGLVELAFRIQNWPTGVVNPEYFEHIPELSFVYYNEREYKNAKWQPVQSYDAVSLSVDRVREVVAEKERLLSGYQSCHAYWLLIVIDYMDPAQDQDAEWPEDTTLGSTRFEKVLLYRPQLGKVVLVPQ